MRVSILLPAALASVLLVACADQTPVEPASSSSATTPSFDWTNNPDIANPRIYRDETHWASCWTDPDNGYRACHSTVPLGGGTEPDCGLQAEGDPIEYQDVGLYDPDDLFSSWIHEIVKGDVFITIRDLNTPGDCFGSALVAEGWGTFMYVDNDIFGVGPEGENANAWRFKGQSNSLTAPDGSTVGYAGHIGWRETAAGDFDRTSVIVNVH